VEVDETEDGIFVIWQNVDQAEYYTVHYGENQSKRIAGTQNNLKLTEADVSRGITYDQSQPSQAVPGKLGEKDSSIPKPGKPGISSVEALSSSQIRLTWSPVSGANYYRVYYAKNRWDIDNDNASATRRHKRP
jgi:hypothetical protein